MLQTLIDIIHQRRIDGKSFKRCLLLQVYRVKFRKSMRKRDRK